jgi:hypothetical protein
MADVDAALIGLVGSLSGVAGGLAVKVWEARQKAADEERSSLRAAERSYQFDALKRLYTDFQPLIFELVEACDSASRRFGNLCKASRQGALDLGPRNWLNDEANPYYLLSTIYRFMAPVVLFKLCRRRLTFVDLRVNDHVRQQYALARLIYQTWNDGYEMKALSPFIDYEPTSRWLKPSDPRASTHVMQHIVIGELDLIAEAMTITGPDGRQRCMDFGEFLEAYKNAKSTLHERAAILTDLFRDFSPDRRPILWRLLLVQATVWKAFCDSAIESDNPVSLGLEPDERNLERLRWWKADHPAAQEEFVSHLGFAAAHARSEYERAVQYSR